MGFVAYTNGLGVDPGEPVNEKDFDPDDWQYHLDHGSVVQQGGPDDPKVLEALASGGEYVDPRDAQIAELQAALAALQEKPPEAPVKSEKPSGDK